MGGVSALSVLFPGIPVSKMIWKDDGLPEGIQTCATARPSPVTARR